MVIRSETGIKNDALRKALEQSLAGKNLKKVLLLPPDYTRMYSGAGRITAIYYDLLKDTCGVDILPALGTHEAMTREECLAFFGEGVPFEKIIVHNWRRDVVKLGEVPAEFISSVSEGLVSTKIDVEVNRLIVDKSYDLIISIGQVVPHEVVGMANYSKNIFVGCGGSSMINSSHMLGAFYGMERVMGRDFSPVRRVFDYAQEKFLAGVPLLYVLTVTTNKGDETFIHGLFIGNQRELFEQAVKMSPKEAGYRVNLGDAYRWSNRRELAAASYDAAIKLAAERLQVSPSDTDALGNQAIAYAKTGNITSVGTYSGDGAGLNEVMYVGKVRTDGNVPFRMSNCTAFNNREQLFKFLLGMK